MKIGCVILNFNDAAHVVSLVEQIRDYDSLSAIVLVDNCSTDDSWQALQELAGDKVHACQTNHNGGYGSGNNFGVKYAREVLGCDHVLIANPDVQFSNDLVKRLARALQEDERRAVASAIQCNAKGERITRSAWRIPHPWRYIFCTGALLRKWGENFYFTLEELCSQPTVEVDCVAGSLLLVSGEKFLTVGGYDEEMFLYCEETTLGSKLKQAGFKSVVCSDMEYLHLHGVTISKSISSAVRRKKILLTSHHLYLCRYLKANLLQRAVDVVVGKIVLLEEAVKTLIKR